MIKVTPKREASKTRFKYELSTANALVSAYGDFEDVHQNKPYVFAMNIKEAMIMMLYKLRSKSYHNGVIQLYVDPIAPVQPERTLATKLRIKTNTESESVITCNYAIDHFQVKIEYHVGQIKTSMSFRCAPNVNDVRFIVEKFYNKMDEINRSISIEAGNAEDALIKLKYIKA